MTFDDALTHLGTEDVLHEDALDKHVSQDPSSWSATESHRDHRRPIDLSVSSFAGVCSSR